MELCTWSIIRQKVNDFNLQKGISSFVNPYSMLKLIDHPDIAQNIDYWYVDGISLVNGFNKYQINQINRFSFDDTSLAPIIFNFAKQNHLKIAIIGTRAELIEKAVLNIEKKYSTKISYSHHGYYINIQDFLNSYKVIMDENISIVICGMGTPFQEDFLIGLKNFGWNGYGFTCGGYLHQIARINKDYYPYLFDRLNIRWLYRIIDEPKLFKRYAIDYPKFFFRFFLFNRRIKKKINSSE